MKRIIGIILAVIGLLLYLVFRTYSGDLIPYPTLWFIIGIIIGIAGLLMFITGKTKTQKETENKIEKQINFLKQYGTKIDVKFKDCEIINNNYFREALKSQNYKVQAPIRFL
jgi:uncharacterized membrane-anchored protein YhcB (DUF1043 family)